MTIVIKQIAKFSIVGVINTIIDFGILNLLVQVFGWPVIWANTVSFSVAVTNSFFMNKYWTFDERVGKLHLQFGGFIIVALVGLGLSDLSVYYFNETMGLHYNWAKFISIFVVFAWNFLASKYLIFHFYSH